jgi:hypothetical protein
LKINSVFIGALLTLVFFGCEQPQTMKVKLITRKELKGIPSASGIEKIDHHFWVVGDNSPWLFELDSTLEVINRIAIHDTTDLISGVLDKTSKHDSEAMISFERSGMNYLLLIGSGSKESRKKAKLINTKNGEMLDEYDLAPFFEIVKEEAKLDGEDLNIEAAACLNDRLYLFNRGKNRMISLKFTQFLDFLNKRTDEIKIKWVTIDLPRLDGIQSGFSGATADEEYDRIIFTASVENTSNWVDDGAVSGSYIGVINLKDAHHHYVPESILLKDEFGVLEIKVESVAIDESTDKILNCILVTDSDGGESEILSIELELN